MNSRVLLVEDEEALRLFVGDSLLSEGYAVEYAADGDEAIEKAMRLPLDLIILDVMLPHKDGFEVCQALRAAGRAAPILMLTARSQIEDTVHGLKIGADDYLTKPFRMEELLARLRALIRRASGQLTPALRYGALVLDPRTSRVTLDGQPVKLTGHELRVLSYLMHHRGRVISQTELTEHIYAQTLDRDSNTVEVFIARLRKKLGAATISTVRGLGYRMEQA